MTQMAGSSLGEQAHGWTPCQALPLSLSLDSPWSSSRYLLRQLCPSPSAGHQGMPTYTAASDDWCAQVLRRPFLPWPLTLSHSFIGWGQGESSGSRRRWRVGKASLRELIQSASVFANCPLVTTGKRGCLFQKAFGYFLDNPLAILGFFYFKM